MLEEVPVLPVTRAERATKIEKVEPIVRSRRNVQQAHQQWERVFDSAERHGIPLASGRSGYYFQCCRTDLLEDRRRIVAARGTSGLVPARVVATEPDVARLFRTRSRIAIHRVQATQFCVTARGTASCVRNHS